MVRVILASLFSILIVFSSVIPSSAINVSADSAILIEADSLETVFSKNSQEKLPMASTTKIMTAIVALENSDLKEEVVITEEMIGAEGSSIYLKVGEKLTMEQLLYALMLSSANDAAEAIAIHISGTIEKFAVLMNKKAADLELKNTSFTNPHGLDDELHYTTAEDLAKLAAYGLKNDTFLKLVSTQKYVINETEFNSERYLTNHNKLLKQYDGAIGVKTGYTKRCGRCLVSAADRNGVTLIAVTLSAPNDWNDHKTMLDYGFSQYECIRLAKTEEINFTFPVLCGDNNHLNVYNKDELSITVKGGTADIKCKIEAIGGKFLFAPIKKDQYIADAVFYNHGIEIGRLPLYADQTINRVLNKSFFEKFK